MIICIFMAFLPSDFMFHSHEDLHHDQSPSTSLNILPPYTPSHQDFHGIGSLLLKRSMSFSAGANNNNNSLLDQQVMNNHGGDDDLSDDGSQAGNERKKIRLNLEQVKALEKSFDLGNKLEPDRKMQLARALNLQPRQVAIWFQNRRARWKTKQLERDYDLLKKQFESVKADNDLLQSQNKKLHAELLALRNGESPEIKSIDLKKETDGSNWSNGSENNSPDNHHVSLNMSTTPLMNTSLSSQLSFKQLFPSSFKSTSITQLLQGSARSDLHCPKLDQTVQDESFSNMFCGVDDQPGFWSWPEQQHQQFQ